MSPLSVLVLGASPNPQRYAFLTTSKLIAAGHKVYPIGIRQGFIDGAEIINESRQLDGIHTVTIYLHPQKQNQYQDYIIGLRPKRVIFNPGAENPALDEKFNQLGIETVDGCTLVMLSAGLF